MKKVVVLVVLICMISLCFLAACASEKGTDGPVRLSTLDREELIEFLASKNVFIPEGFENLDVVAIVAALEEDPNKPCVLGEYIVAYFVEDVRAVVKEYYGIQEEE